MDRKIIDKDFFVHYQYFIGLLVVLKYSILFLDNLNNSVT